MQPTGWVPSAASPPHPPGKGDLQPQLDSALQDVNDMYLLLEETEKQAVRRALIEERGRFCTFITFLQPVVVGPWGCVALGIPPLAWLGSPWVLPSPHPRIRIWELLGMRPSFVF